MKLNKTISIQQPPFSDNTGKVITPQPVMTDILNLVFIDNVLSKTVYVQISGTSIHIPLWSNEEYDQIGDWTQQQAENRILEILGDNEEEKLNSYFPETLEQKPNHPGTVLSKMIKNVGIQMTDSCSCKRHALEMNKNGNDWCEQNIDTVVGWLRDEAKRRNLPFLDAVGKLLVGRAIKKSRKLLANETVPENDEDLDQF
jgi:hypothetical protein